MIKIKLTNKIKMVENHFNSFSGSRSVQQILNAAAEVINKRHEEMTCYLSALEHKGINTESKLWGTSDEVLMANDVDMAENLIKAFRSVIKDGQLITEFQASNARGIQTRLEHGNFDREQYKPEEKERTFKTKQTCQDGKKYEGYWSSDGMRDGYGVMNNGDGALYEGYWKDNKQHGRGCLVDIDGGLYVGEWADGKKEGQGTYFYVGGGMYEGGWKEDKKHGYGV